MEKNTDEIDTVGLGCALESFKEYDEVMNLVKKLKDVYDDQSLSEACYQRFVYILNQYQEQPHLLDRDLDAFLGELLSIASSVENDKKLRNMAFKFLYVITKVRGYKVIVRHLPHEVSDVEPVLALINEQDPQDCETWETRYILLLWMSIVVIIPFHMARLDDTSHDVIEKKKPIMERILDVIKLYLSVGDKARDSAAFLASRFITRPDVKALYLGEYLDWSMKMLVSCDNFSMAGLSLQAGILSSLALLFKHGKREDVKEYGGPVLKKILECGFKDSKCTTVRKMSLKLIQRIGLSFLKVKVAKWRYSRGTRSLADNLALGDTLPSVVDGISDAMEEDDEGYDIPGETEDVIEQLLVGLRDKDTVIRWSAAKGIGRVTDRLPKELADDVVTSVLELFNLRESDSAWHGGCLALAEFGRRGLVLPQHLKEVVDVVLRALVYDELRGNFSVGAHIRDAACYVCWSFARAFDPEVLHPYVNSIAGALLVTAVFDREVNCRRAASAAFQENVGRQGTFPHGIEIVTNADYYSVGARQNAFLNISVYIGQFEEYLMTLVKHLMDYKINHWDSPIRELSAKALGNLTMRNYKLVAENTIPKLLAQATCMDLNSRHGAILSIAEIIQAFSAIVDKEGKNINELLDLETVSSIRNITFILNERRLFRGLGGIFMRSSVCSLIEKASAAGLPYHEDGELIKNWREILDSCLQHIDVSVRSAAVAALPQFCKQYYAAGSLEIQELLNSYLAQLKSNHLETRCGYALAVGSLPQYILQGNVLLILEALSDCARLTEEHASWAEARRDAIKAISQVVATVGVDTSGSSNHAICSENIEMLYGSMLACMDDYTLDSRGEIGAVVREAAMLAIQEVTIMIVKHNPKMLHEEIISDIFNALLQQCIEKIDRTRSVAGTVFAALLHSEPPIPHVPHRQELLVEFPSELCSEMNWASPADTFQHFVRLLCLKKYTYNLLLGFTVSVGGLTESLVKYSRAALIDYLISLQNHAEQMIHISDTLTAILKDNLQNDRILIPFLKMMDHLLISGIVFINSNEKMPFNELLLDLVWQACYKSSDPQKLIAVIDLLCDLLQFTGPCQKRSMSRLAIFLCHRFPRIRKLSASKFYEALISYDILPENVTDTVVDVLSETDWNLPVELLRPLRNDLCEKLGIPSPVLRKL